MHSDNISNKLFRAFLKGTTSAAVTIGLESVFGIPGSSILAAGIGEAINVLLECPNCSEQRNDRIGNLQFNDLGCKNCWHQFSQFTNACSFTFENGRIGHVALELHRVWSHDRNPVEKGIFAPDRPSWLYFPFSVYTKDLYGRQFGLSSYLLEDATDTILGSHNQIITPNDNNTWWPIRWAAFWKPSIPDEYKDGRLLSLRTDISSDRGDKLSGNTRGLVQPWQYGNEIK